MVKFSVVVGALLAAPETAANLEDPRVPVREKPLHLVLGSRDQVTAGGDRECVRVRPSGDGTIAGVSTSRKSRDSKNVRTARTTRARSRRNFISVARHHEHALGESANLMAHPRTDNDERGDHREHARLDASVGSQTCAASYQIAATRSHDDRGDADDGKRHERGEDERLLRGVDERSQRRHSLTASVAASPESVLDSLGASVVLSLDEPSVGVLVSVVPVSGIEASSPMVVADV